MRLLVSVRNADEAAAAVAGGAEIVDAKDPASSSSIGAVNPAALEAIRQVVPPAIRLSAALGDVTTVDDVASAFAGVTVPLAYVKLGFRGVADATLVAPLLAEAVRRAALLPSRPAVIGVGYADAGRVGALPPLDLVAMIYHAGADGLLLDTARKDGGSTFQIVAARVLEALRLRCEADELTLAIGGGLDLGDIEQAGACGATIFGVRGAACDGGRDGVVREARVRRLAQAIRQERARA